MNGSMLRSMPVADLSLTLGVVATTRSTPVAEATARHLPSRFAAAWTTALFGLAFPAALVAQASPATSVTLFNSGRVLVRQTLPMTIAAGRSTTTIPIGTFTPSTFAPLDSGVRLVGVQSLDEISEESLLRRYVGHPFEIDTGSHGTRRATLLALDPERWQWADQSGVRFGRPGRIVWPADLVPLQVTATVTLVSDRPRSSVRVMYETAGASWSASYQLFLGPRGHIEGTASISSGSLDLAEAEVQLLAGDIGQGPSPQAKAYAPSPMLMARDEVATRQTAGASTEAIGETHLYTLPGLSTFVPGSSFTVALFDPAPIHPARRYVVDGALPFYGGYGPQADEQPVPVDVSYHADRKLGTPLGDLALPAGYVGIFDADRGGRMQLVGQGYIDHTAPGDALIVPAGTAFDVTARRTQLDYVESRTQPTPNVPSRTVVTSNYRVVLRNAKDSAVVVDVQENRGGEWSVLESSRPAIRKSSTRTVFEVPVAARDSSVLTYRVRVVW